MGNEGEKEWWGERGVRGLVKGWGMKGRRNGGEREEGQGDW